MEGAGVAHGEPDAAARVVGPHPSLGEHHLRAIDSDDVAEVDGQRGRDNSPRPTWSGRWPERRENCSRSHAPHVIAIEITSSSPLGCVTGK